MNIQDFNQVGGFPLSTNNLHRMQEAYSLFNALGQLAGNLTIISGCQVNGANVTSGVVFIAGELLEFRGGLALATVVVKEEVANLMFQDGNSKVVHRTRYATFGTGVTTYQWADFKRGIPTGQLSDLLASKVHVDTFNDLRNLVNTMKQKLDGIAPGAQVNVTPNWNAIAGEPGFIQNKPSLFAPLYAGTFPITDFATDALQAITFPSVGTDKYMVVGSLVSTGPNWNNDNDVFFQVREKTNTGFKLLLREVTANSQNLLFEYKLLPHNG